MAQGVIAVLDGEDVSGELRTEQMGNAASKIAAYPLVREGLITSAAGLSRHARFDRRWSGHGNRGFP